MQSVSSNGVVISFNPPKEYNEIDIIPILQAGDQGAAIVSVTFLLFLSPKFILPHSIHSNLYVAGTLQTTSPRALNQLVSYSANRRQTMEKKKPKKGKQTLSCFPVPVAAVTSSLQLLSTLPLPVLPCLFRCFH